MERSGTPESPVFACLARKNAPKIDRIGGLVFRPLEFIFFFADDRMKELV
jgi:hypothetical protein